MRRTMNRVQSLKLKARQKAMPKAAASSQLTSYPEECVKTTIDSCTPAVVAPRREMCPWIRGRSYSDVVKLL